jgi:hypothetical protein
MVLLNRISQNLSASSSAYSVRVGIKKPTQKNPPKKTHLKNPLKMFLLGFFKFFIFYENNTNFSLSN